MLIFSLKKFTGEDQHRPNYLYEWEALVTRNLHAKYEGSIWKGSKLMTNFIVVQQTNRQTRQNAIATRDIKIENAHLTWASEPR